MRRFVSLNASTCIITDMLDHTNIMPAIGRRSSARENTAAVAAAAPRPREPVSPIITEAGLELNTRYPNSPPSRDTQNAESEKSCSARVPSPAESASEKAR